MSAASAILAARNAGIQLSVEGDDLVLEAAVPPPLAVLDQLSRQKPAVVSWLRPGSDGWSVEDWHAFFEERAGIAEYDGELPRDQAEARAFACCVFEWLARNPVRSPPGRCLCCGDGGHADDPLQPYCGNSTGHARLHSRCWFAWHASWKAKAVSALAAIGIAAPANLPDDLGRNGRA